MSESSPDSVNLIQEIRRVASGASGIWPWTLLVAGIVWTPTFAMVLAMFAAGFYIVRSLVTLLPRLREHRLASMARAVIYAAVTGLSFYTFTIYDDVTRGRVEAVQASLEAYRSAEGTYPEELEALVPRFIASIPTASVAPLAQWPFGYRARGDGYELHYTAGFLVSKWYDSRTGEWRVRD